MSSTSSTKDTGAAQEGKFYLLKRDLYECPDHNGYTGIRDLAGLYGADELRSAELMPAYSTNYHGHYALKPEAAPEFTGACFHDLAIKHLCSKIVESENRCKEAKAEVARLTRDHEFEAWAHKCQRERDAAVARAEKAEAERDKWERHATTGDEVLDRLRARLAKSTVLPPNVAATLSDEDTIGYVLRYGGMCRDCADMGGICPSSGLPCKGADKAVRYVLSALKYGLEHDFLPVRD